MITDISSVVADFIASGKPYMVTNVSGMPERLFRERYPSSEAAYLLGEDLAELPAVLQALEHGAEDVLASTRRKLKTYLLGPDHPDAHDPLQQRRERRLRPRFGPGPLNPVPASPALHRDRRPLPRPRLEPGTPAPDRGSADRFPTLGSSPARRLPTASAGRLGGLAELLRARQEAPAP